MTIYMVSGLHRKEWARNILSNFTRQEFANKRLLVVENGDGIGALTSEYLPDSVNVIRSERGVSVYINAALQWLRQHSQPGDWFCKCDADDYYAPQYLEQVYGASQREPHVDFAGRRSIYIRATSGRLWRVDASIFHGPTLAARIDRAVDFPVVRDWGEDVAWCEAMVAAGRMSATLPPEGFCYCRWDASKHAWPCTDEDLRAAWSASPVYDVGEFEKDLEVVDGARNPHREELLPLVQVDHTNFMPFRLLRERAARG